MNRPDAATLRDRLAHVEWLADVAASALGISEWRPGAHGDEGTPKPAATGEGHRFSLSRSCTCEAGVAQVADHATLARDALSAAGCVVEERTFGGGEAVWIVARMGASQVVTKLASNGNRLVTADSGDFTDASAAEAAALMAAAE